MYERFLPLANQVAKPDFVLFLDAPTDVIMGRIKKRGIASEQSIQSEYLMNFEQDTIVCGIPIRMPPYMFLIQATRTMY